VTAGYLGSRQASGIAATTLRPNLYVAAGWVVHFPSDELPPIDCEIYHAAARGPGGTFVMYIGDSFYDIGERGDINAYHPSNPAYVRRGESVTFYWSIGTGTAPLVWLYLRQPGTAIL